MTCMSILRSKGFAGATPRNVERLLAAKDNVRMLSERNKEIEFARR